ncbi:MAG: tetratricopeptide repeat protein, partial [Acidobacteriaceae bacterium]
HPPYWRIANLASLSAFMLSLAVSKPLSAQVSPSALHQADTVYRAGTAALAQHDLATAQADFEQALRLAPNAEPAHVALGVVLLNRGDLQRGIHELQLALKLRPTDTTAQLNLAVAYEQLRQPAKSIPLFIQIEAESRARKQPLTASILSAYAHALVATGNLAQAAQQMKAATQADPRDAQLHDDLGSIYAQQKSWQNAREQFTTALQINPQLAAAHLHLGLALQALNQPNSLDEILKARDLAPDNQLITLELGKAYAAAGHDDQAVPLFQKILATDPQSVDAMYELALADQRADHPNDAIDLFQKVLQADPTNAIAATDLGMALTQAQRARDAVPILQHAAQLAPTSVTALEDLAAAYVQLNQFDDAETELGAALKLAPNRPQLHYDLGLAYKMQDDATKAIPEFEVAEKLDPQQPEAPYALGLLYLQDGRYADAARELKASLTLRPKNGEGWATLGSVYNHLNQLPQAIDALQHAIQQVPEQPDPHLTLASVLIKQNKLAEATDQRKLAANLMRSHMNLQRAEVATHTGNALLKTGDLAGAAVQFNDALSFDPTYADAHLGLAHIYDAQDKPTEAAAERAKAASPSPQP